MTTNAFEDEDRLFPRELMAPLFVVAMGNIIVWSIIAGMFEAHFTLFGNPPTAGDQFGFFVLLLFLLALLGAGGLYLSFVANHRRPVIRAVAGLGAYVATLIGAALLLGSIKDVFALAGAIVAVGPLLAIALPGGTFGRTVARITAVGLPAVGVVAIADVLSLFPDRWLLVMSTGLFIGITLVWGIESLRPANRADQRAWI